MPEGRRRRGAPYTWSARQTSTVLPLVGRWGEELLRSLRHDLLQSQTNSQASERSRVASSGAISMSTPLNPRFWLAIARTQLPRFVQELAELPLPAGVAHAPEGH